MRVFLIIFGMWIEIPKRSQAEENPMNSSAVLAAGAHEQSRQSGVALAATLLELLSIAQSKVELDHQAAQACLSRATALLAASLEREGGSKAESAFRGKLSGWQAKRLISYIEENLDRPIRSSELIRLTGISAGHFFRTFKATFGEAPLAYIARRRVKFAQQMMLTTNHSLCHIALDCGLCDQSHLTRLFRQYVGTTPSKWRQEYVLGSLELTPANADGA
ncbi:helix-turn-helix transcriptional regulator [Halopseudomonas bauzanensis]|uniref:Helix-turn-helix transcriptional regulator n=2 Tax=Halopseudomonas bauzanensis TaxID=653930 RepID=A0A4U0YIN9_9GAMM|nr:helix-turn-helix transcriptional regulator [Halopseudomonas bauzanensis]